MAMTDAQDLLKHDLGDILYAEKQILKALKPMIRETSDPQMRSRLEQHQDETEQQIGNLERAFEAIGEKARGQKCPGILGILEEKKEFKDEEEPSKPVLEAFNLGAGLRVEHYEIAAYGSAIALARSLGQEEVVRLLQQNLEQEQAMAQFIESASANVLQQAATMMRSEAAGNGAGTRGASRRGATSRGATGRSTSSRSTSSRSTGNRGTTARGSAKRGSTARGATRAGGTKRGAAKQSGRTSRAASRR